METVLNSYMEPLPGEAGVPDWVHLLPAGTFSGIDGRGPFELGDPAELIANSLKPGRKLPIDINHATDLVAIDGQPTPASGWIVSLEARHDGIWGRVEWTMQGRWQIEERQYGYLSPVFTHPKSGPKRVTQLLRAALTNDPNLTLTALHHRQHEGNQNMEKALREALRLPDTASQDDILKAAKERVASLKAATEKMSRIAQAAGLDANADEAQIVTALNARRSSGAGADVTAELQQLQDENKQLNTRLTEVVTNSARKDAEAAIDRAIEDGKIVPALRDRFIARHMKDPADVDAEIKLMPSLNAGGLGRRRPVDDGGDAALSDEDAAVCELMGIDPKKFAETSKTLQKERL